MTATVTAPTVAAAPPARAGRRLRAAAIPAGYTLASVLLYLGIWLDPNGGYLVDSGQDQNQWEWFFAVTARAVVEFDNPLFTTLQNHPDGVNLMGNTTMLGVSVPLTPVTLLLGPCVTWTLVLTASLAATATAWYWLFHRRLRRSRFASIVGGGLCGFAPPVITHAHAHPNFVALFVLPFLVALLLRLWHGDRPIRTGVFLGLLLAYQLFLGEEVLLLFAVGMTIFGIAYIAMAPREARLAAVPLATGLAVAAAVSLGLVAFPLYWQFFGPQSYSGLLHGNGGNDLLAIPAFASRSLAGGDDAVGLAWVTEQNAFFGWPLVLATGFAAAALWRVRLARALSVVILAAVALSLGTFITVDGTETPIPGPWLPLSKLPLFDSVLESRVAMIGVPAIALLLALAIDRTRLHFGLALRQRAPRLLCLGALAAILVPIAPLPFTAVDRVPTPEFFTAGTWRDYVDEGATLVPVPPPGPGSAEALHWQVRADLGFRLPEGYFVGPSGTDRAGRYGAVPSDTSVLLREVRDSGEVPVIDDHDRARVRADLKRWDAQAVVLARGPGDDALLTTVDMLLGPPENVDGVWVWRVE